MKIRTKINLSFIIIFFIVIVSSGLYVLFFNSNLIKKIVYSNIYSSNIYRAEHLRTFVKDQEKLSLVLAGASVYRDFLNEPETSKQYPVVKEKVVQRFERTIESDPLIDEVFIINNKGKVILSSDKTQEGVDKSSDNIFIKGKEGLFFKDINFSSLLNKINYTIAVPIKNSDGVSVGVSVLRYLPSDLFSIIKNEQELGQTEESFLVNSSKFFITPSIFLGEGVILNQKDDVKNTTNCFNEEEKDYVKNNGYIGLKDKFKDQVIEAMDYRNISVITTHAYIPETGWCLVTKVDKADLFSFIPTLIYLFIFVVFSTLIIFFFSGFFVSKKITDPIEELITGTKKIEQGDLDYRVNVSTKDEIGVLSNSFNLMAESVRKSQSEIEMKVQEQTKEISEKSKELENQKSAILNVLEDVEKEKLKIENIANELEKFKLAVANASDQIVITDQDGIVIYSNNAVEKITGYKPEEALGKKAGVLWKTPMSLEFYKNIWDIIKTKKKNYIGEIQNKRKNGEFYTAILSISPVFNKKEEIIYFVAIERDITKEKEVDKAKTEFVSLASHQLRTPLSAINWYTEMLLAGDAGAVNDEQKKYIEEIAIGNKRMIDLVDDLLNVSRLDMGTFIPEIKSINILELVKNVLKESQSQILEKKLIIEESYDPNIPEQFMADEKLMRMIFQNLLSNAVKYTPASGLIKYNLSKINKGENFDDKKIEEESLAFSISDSGIGIPSNQQDKIFSKLFRADNARMSETEGTGLGLYAIKSITDLSGGLMWFKSEEGKGSTFYVTFPMTGMTQKSINKN